MPEAATLKAAVCPGFTVWLEGWVVMDGATGAAFTVSVAELLVTVPAALLTTQRKVAPLSLAAVGVRV